VTTPDAGVVPLRKADDPELIALYADDLMALWLHRIDRAVHPVGPARRRRHDWITVPPPVPRCRHGHPREGNAYRRRDGKLGCRTCERERARGYRARRRARAGGAT